MKKYFLVFLICVLQYAGSAQVKQHTITRPRLVVGIVIDQMRWDYLYRYYDEYKEGGFRRMINNGFNCDNTHINYLPSFTAPGHACIYTGTVPSIHGIAANDWIENQTGRSLYCTEDTSVATVGSTSKAGKMSPANLISSTVTDELKMSTNFKSKIYGFSIKDRGSILPVGHLADGAFWFDDLTGNFISSTYYKKDLPGWLHNFNNKRWADTLMAAGWSLLNPPGSYKHSLRDDNKYEGSFKGEDAPVFPHSVAGWKSRGYYGLRYLPGGNTIVLKAAKACIKNEGLGQGKETDFLCVSLSSPDYAGHVFGPNALEMEDMFLRLDRDLASFLRYLDERVGEGEYLVFLTADHGAAHNAQYMQDLGMPGGNAWDKDLQAGLNAYLKKQFGYASVVKSLTNYQVYLNEDGIKDKSRRNAVKDAIMDYLGKTAGVAYMIDMERPQMAAVPKDIMAAAINGYHRGRSGCIQIILQPGWYNESVPTGTTHGSGFTYDTHIPLLWYGWNIPHGASNRTIHMTDIAPTLSALLHIQMPSGSIGKVITEITDK